MTEQSWVPPFLEALRELSDVSAQRRAWIDGDLSDFPTPAELVCQVFDDSGLDEELAAGPVFSSEGDDLLRQLSSAVEGADISGHPGSWLNGVPWARITGLAKRALVAISRPEAAST